MFSASTKAASGTVPATLDPQFNYVTMLLHGDGTNGAQNNTFLDSSTNNFTISRLGNPTQGSFSPYGSNWSNAFGTTTYLNAPASSAQFSPSTGDVTIEGWFYFTNLGVDVVNVFGCNNGSGANQKMVSYIETNVSIHFDISPTGGASQATSASGAVVNNTWCHLAFVRNSGTAYIYVNGTSVASGSATGNLSSLTQPFYIGYVGEPYGISPTGYVSNFRYVNGTAVYTSTFTPSTSPLTAITNTKLLTCQSNRFIDNSTNNFPISLTGTPSVQRFNPFGASTAYSTSVIGGSGYFGGSSSGDYLRVGPSTAFGFGTGDFTFEAWIYPNAYNGTFVICDVTLNKATLYINTSNLLTIYFSGLNITGLPVTPFAWNHVACVRSSGSVKTYVNGVANTATSVTNDLGSSEYMQIGVESGSYFNGYISNFRAVKGTAVYTANFTPPTAPVTAISGTSLLTNFTNGAIFDNAMMNDLVTVDSAQISTSVVKYGTGSLAFDGAGDYLKSPQNQVLNFNTGNFTVEFWANISSGQNQEFVVDATSGGFGMSLFSGSVYYEAWGVANFIAVSYAGYYNTWTHVAVCKSNGTSRMFFNGVIVGTYNDTNNFATSGGLNIGGSSARTRWLLGYLDDVRITKGYARYTANFTPPTAAFFNTGPY
jgi:hypothetical protein